MDAPNTLDMRRLPAGVRRVVRALGTERAVALLQARGGTRIHIPNNNDGVLSEIVGRDGVHLLQHEFGAGSELDLPVAEKVVLELRNAAIRSDYQSGRSIQALALQWGLTRRHVQNVVHDVPREMEPEKAEQQGDLFAGWVR